jgi:hypothetical protein
LHILDYAVYACLELGNGLQQLACGVAVDRVLQGTDSDFGIAIDEALHRFLETADVGGKLKGDLRMRFAASVGNIFNRTLFCGPNTNFSSSAFGTVNTQCNQARSVQFGLRLDY